MFATGSVRWGDPRARLLSGEESRKYHRPQALTALRLEEPASIHLAGLGRTLDVAWRGLATRLAESGQADGAPQVRLEPDADGKIWIRVSPLEAVPEPPSLVALRNLSFRMLPQVDLPELLLEVDAWTGFATEFTHLAKSSTRRGSRDQHLRGPRGGGLQHRVQPGARARALTRGPALARRAELRQRRHAEHGERRLVDHQATLELAQRWGGGEVASADGLRFVVPVRTLNAGHNPKYFGQSGRGVTYSTRSTTRSPVSTPSSSPARCAIRCSSSTGCSTSTAAPSRTGRDGQRLVVGRRVRAVPVARLPVLAADIGPATSGSGGSRSGSRPPITAP